MKLKWITVGLTVAAMSITACSSSSGDSEGSSTKPLKVGYFLPLTGSGASYGPGLVAATELAVKDINAAGGVLGHQIELTGSDSATDATIASQAVDKLLGERANVLIGSGSSSVTLAVLGKIVSARTMMCSGSDSADALSTAPTQGYYFHTYPQSRVTFPGVADMLAQDDRKKIALVGRADAVGQSILNTLDKSLTEQGLKPVLIETFDPTSTNFNSVASKVAGAQPDSVFVQSFIEGGALIRALLQQGIKADQIYATDSIGTAVSWKTVDPTNQGVMSGMKGVTAGPDYDQAFPKRLLESKPGLTTTLYGAYTYDCVVLSALAAVAADSTDPTVMKDKMIGLTTGTEECRNFTDCKKLLDDGKSIHYVGVSGPNSFDETGSPTRGALSIWKMDAQSKPAIVGVVSCGQKAPGQCEITAR